MKIHFKLIFNKKIFLKLSVHRNHRDSSITFLPLRVWNIWTTFPFLSSNYITLQRGKNNCIPLFPFFTRSYAFIASC